jgi:predicted HD phosphohydrolase
LGEACSRRHVEVTYCDKCDPNCEYPLEEVFDVDGEDLCEECLKETFRKEK